jgi:hypothetical protein
MNPTTSGQLQRQYECKQQQYGSTGQNKQVTTETKKKWISLGF